MTILERVVRTLYVADPGKRSGALWDSYTDITIKIIDAFLAVAAEDGWHMQRNEATEEMVKSGTKIVGHNRRGEPWSTKVYRAMLTDPTAQFEWNE